MPLLLQPLQAPVALHRVLKFGVGGVGGIERGDGAQQHFGFRRFLITPGRLGLAQHGDQLPLIDQIDIAAQRRGRPRVVRHTQADVRRGCRSHAHLALDADAGLDAINAGRALVSQELAPGRIGEDHQFRDDLVERRAAFALADLDVTAAIPIDTEVVVAHVRGGRRFAAHFFERMGEAPEKLQRTLERKCAAARFEVLLRDLGIEQIVTQVGADLDPINRARGSDDRAVALVHVNIERDRRHRAALDQGKALHDLVRQHGDFVARHVDGGHAAARNHVQRRLGCKAQARRGDVNADAGHAGAGLPDRDGVVDLRRRRIVDGKCRAVVRQRQV